MRYITFFALFFALSLFSSEESRRDRVYHHMQIKDNLRALEEAKEAIECFPDSGFFKQQYVQVLFRLGLEQQAIDAFYAYFPRESWGKLSREFLEEMGWGVVKCCANASQYSLRVCSLFAAYLAQDSKSVDFLVNKMNDSNSFVRSLAIQLSANYRDAAIQKEILYRLDEEKDWGVRLELIKAVGNLKIISQKKRLIHLLEDERTSYQEKQCAMQALLALCDNLTYEEVKSFFFGKKAGQRELACELSGYLRLPKAQEKVLYLLKDPHKDVRMSALNAIGSYYQQTMTQEEIRTYIKPLIKDPDPYIGVTANWVLDLHRANESSWDRWLTYRDIQVQRYAAAALAKTGPLHQKIIDRVFSSHPDLFVKLQLAMRILKSGEKKEEAAQFLITAIEKKKGLWMWEALHNRLFYQLLPTKVRHIEHIANYPTVVDHMLQIELFSLLAYHDPEKAIKALIPFLYQPYQHVSSMAAYMLVKDGQQEAMQLVKKVVNSQDRSLQIQAAIVLALYGKDETMVPLLQELYPLCDREQKLQILEAISQVGKTTDFLFFLDIMQEPYPTLRVLNAASLLRCLHY